MDEDAVAFGLGYRHYQPPSRPPLLAHGAPPPPHGPEPVSASADSLVQLYLQQCLDYHEQQEMKRTMGASSDLPPSTTIQTKIPTLNNSAPHAKIDTIIPTPPAQQPDPLTATATKLEQWKAKNLIPNDNILPCTGHSLDMVTEQGTMSPVEFRLQRERGLQRDQERQRRALLKNLEYVSRRETERLQHIAAELEERKQMEAMAESRYQAILEQRQAQLMANKANSQAGIGSRKRQRFQKEQERQQQSSSSVAVYVSGIPTDGSIDEKFVQQLFGCYGTIRKVHFYREKNDRRQLKGDGLIVFEFPREGNSLVGGDDGGQNLVATVCSQVSFCALLYAVP